MATFTADLTPGQRESLHKLRELVSDITKPKHHDAYLARWLKAENYKPEKAANKFREHCKWRKEYGIDNIDKEWNPPQYIKPLSEFTYVGFSKDESAISIIPLGYWDVKGLLQSMNAEDLILSILCQHVRTTFALDKLSEEKGRYIWKHIIIIDMENVDYYTAFYKAAWKVAFKLSKLIADHMPDILTSTYFINCPSFVCKAISIATQLGIAESITSLLKVYGTDRSTWVPALLEVMEPDQLPAYWGGSQVDPKDGDPKCPSKVCVRCEIPQSVYIKNKLSLIKKSLTKAIVEHGGTLKISRNVKIPGSELRWSFYSDAQDVDLSIRHQLSDGTEEIIVETSRLQCFYTLIQGKIICKKKGLYTAIFDNSYFRLRDKTLHFALEVTPP